MKKVRLWSWWPVSLGTATAVGLLAFAFGPSHKRAVANSEAVVQASEELQAKLATLKQMPARKQQLDSLVQMLGAFRASLFRINQVDLAMRALEGRARAAGLQCWILNPSVPTLVALEAARDSIAALNLALLPVEFECLGDFLAVGHFLASEERLPQFCKWERLTVTPGPRTPQVRAHAEVQLFLLPSEFPEGGAS
jgi:hypothetical protein